jgi:glutathione S-transferase
VKLYFFAGSCAAQTTRLELEYKRLAYELVHIPPVTHGLILERRGLPGTTIPALEVDGRVVHGTRQISRLLDELRPDPPLFPRAPERRAAVEEAERWGEDLQDLARRLLYCTARRKPRTWARMMTPGQSVVTRLRVLVQAQTLVALASEGHGCNEEACRRDAAQLPELLAQIEAWIAEGLLDQEELNAADFEIGPNVRSFLAFADLAPLVERHPAAAAHALRVLPEFPGRFPRVLPAEWFGAYSESASSSRR